MKEINEELYVEMLEDGELYDYITNLQQENERLKEKSINEVLKIDFDMCVKDLKKANKKIEKLEDYKSRVEKAVEYIENCPKYLWENVNTKELLNILNGKYFKW